MSDLLFSEDDSSPMHMLDSPSSFTHSKRVSSSANVMYNNAPPAVVHQSGVPSGPAVHTLALGGVPSQFPMWTSAPQVAQ